MLVSIFYIVNRVNIKNYGTILFFFKKKIVFVVFNLTSKITPKKYRSEKDVRKAVRRRLL